MTTEVPDPPSPVLEEQLCFAVYLAGHAFNRLYRRVLAELGLTYPQYLVMLVLWQGDGVTVTAVGDRLMLDSGTLTPLLKRIEAAGLIRRERSREDERQVLLFLTEHGNEMRAKGRCVPGLIAAEFGADAGLERRLTGDLVTLRELLNHAVRDQT